MLQKVSAFCALDPLSFGFVYSSLTKGMTSKNTSNKGSKTRKAESRRPKAPPSRQRANKPKDDALTQTAAYRTGYGAARYNQFIDSFMEFIFNFIGEVFCEVISSLWHRR